MQAAECLPCADTPIQIIILAPLLLCFCPQAILQSLELLLVRNYIPRRSFFIALGHDEEVGPLHPMPISGIPIGQCGEGVFTLVQFAPQLRSLQDMTW